jgi:hypothetical protein
MNKASLILALIAFLASTGSAQILVTETFDYPSDSSMRNADGGTGWSTPWMADLELNTELPEDFAVTAESLDSSAFRSRGLEPTGNRFQVPESNAGARLFRGLENKITWGQNGTHYISFLVRWTGSHATASSRLQLALGEQGSADVFSGATFVGLHSAESDDAMRLVVRNQGETAYGMESLPAGRVYFVVARLVTAPGDLPDEVSAVVYGPEDEVSVQEPDEWMASAVKSRTGLSVLVDLGLFVYKGNREASFDELRIGNSWESVTAR